MNVFLDLGTHYGEGLAKFVTRLGITREWQVHAYEPNPTIHQPAMPSWVNLHREAISVANGTAKFQRYGARGDSGGSSLILDFGDKFGEPVEVTTVDILDVLQPFSNDDIYIKLDIEGAEYVVLDRMLSSPVLNRIRLLSVEWHDRFLIGKDEEHARLVAEFTKRGVNLEEWI